MEKHILLSMESLSSAIIIGKESLVFCRHHRKALTPSAGSLSFASIIEKQRQPAISKQCGIVAGGIFTKDVFSTDD